MKTQFFGGKNTQTLNNIMSGQDDIIVSRDPSSGFMYYSLHGKVDIVNLYQGELFKTDLKFRTIRSAVNDLVIKEIPTTDGQRTFQFINSPMTKIIGVSGRGGGGGKKGVIVEDEGTALGTATVFDFIGAGVDVTFSNGTATINIPGGIACAENGLEILPNGCVGLGGPLTADTNIDFNGFNLSLSNVPAGGMNPSVLTLDAGGNIQASPFVSSTCWLLDGNTVGSEKWIGTIDAFDFPIRTSNVQRAELSATGFWGFNTNAVSGQLFTLQGSGATSATYLFRGYNSTPTEMFSVRNDGYIYAGIANGSITVGRNSGFVSTTTDNTFFGVAIATGLTTGIANTAVGSMSMNGLLDGLENTALGYFTLKALTSGFNNIAIGPNACLILTSGGYNIGIGSNALKSVTTDQANIGIGHDSLLNTTGYGNVSLGFASGRGNTTGAQNIFLGFSAGYNQTTASHQLFIDNRDRGSAANDLALSLIFGTFSATTANQFLRVNGNVGILTHTFGTNADGVLGILNGTAPTTSPANMIQLFSVDTDDNTASLGLRTEQAVVTEAVVSDRTLKVTINGTIYKICLKV